VNCDIWNAVNLEVTNRSFPETIHHQVGKAENSAPGRPMEFCDSRQGRCIRNKYLAKVLNRSNGGLVVSYFNWIWENSRSGTTDGSGHD